MQDLHLTNKEDSAVKWELSAREAIFPIGGKEIFLKSLDLKINRTPVIYLASGAGVYEIEKGYVTLDKSVEMNVKDTKFTTNSLKWNSAEELITTDDDVKFTGKNFLIEGTGLTAAVSQQKVRILKNVKAVFYSS